LKCFTATANTVGEIVNISNYDIFIRKIMFNRKIIGLMLFEVSKRLTDISYRSLLASG
jgi:hypothetical protein